MPTKIHILATCLNPELIENTLLVFKTLKVGFPDSTVFVWLNNLGFKETMAVRSAAPKGSQFVQVKTVHDAWVENLVLNETEAFWIVDTDVVFHKQLASEDGSIFAGRHEPDFLEPWTGTVRVERLHTAVMFLDAPAIRSAMCRWVQKLIPKGFPFAPETQFFRQQFIPSIGEPAKFYDTCAGLYQAIGGTKFSDYQNSCFDHLHCGTYVDSISSCPALKDLPLVHRMIWSDPSRSIGLLGAQNEFYLSRKA